MLTGCYPNGNGCCQKIDTAHTGQKLDIFRASNLLERIGGKYAAQAGLGSVQQYMILGLLFLDGDQSLSQLRQNTLVTKQTITGLVERMRQGGYLETYTDPDDRRVTKVRITGKGKETFEKIRSVRIPGNREIFAVLGDQEVQQLAEILPKLVAHLDRVLEER